MSQKNRSEDLAQALRRRFRTSSPRASMSMRSLGLENYVQNSQLDEVEDPYGDTIPDYDPESPEPRYLQMAKAELLRRKDLRCKDCGFMGLPSADQKCPDCGGPMEEPQAATAPPAMSTEAIRKAIRAQWAQKQGVAESTEIDGMIWWAHHSDENKSFSDRRGEHTDLIAKARSKSVLGLHHYDSFHKGRAVVRGNQAWAWIQPGRAIDQHGEIPFTDRDRDTVTSHLKTKHKVSTVNWTSGEDAMRYKPWKFIRSQESVSNTPKVVKVTPLSYSGMWRVHYSDGSTNNHHMSQGDLPKVGQQKNQK